MLATFQPMGPAAIVNGQVEKVTPNNEVSGAIHTVLTHPTNANVMYIGSVNGGIWRTTNALSNDIHWQPMTDDLPSLSIGAMAMDPNQPSRILAGTGRYSSFAEGNQLAGLMLTEDAGLTWEVIDDPLLVGKNISGVAVNGDVMLASAGAGTFGRDPVPSGGLYRSEDGGATWENIELLIRDTDFPEEPLSFEAFDLVADPTDETRYYVSVADEGIFRTDDMGETWTDVSSGDARLGQLYALMTTNGLDNNNLEMAVASNGRIYMALISDGQPLYIGYSETFGGTWIEMDLPQTLEATGAVGVSPRAKPGGQGAIHFSIIADPNDPFTVYVGGDRQDGDLSFAFGNSIGARDFTGKLFRGDTRNDPIGNTIDANGVSTFGGYSPQWEHLTHSNLVPEMPEGGTRRGSAPHADSREMAFDARGNLIEVNDGGVYRRTSPTNNQGDWYSINGNLQITEVHNIAYDNNSNILVGGSQDNGSIQQQAAGSRVWAQIATDNQSILGQVFRSQNADGGDIAIDDRSDPNFSTRYHSQQNLGQFVRQVYDASNNLVDETLLTPNIIGNFITPVIINAVNARRIVVGGTTGIFESFDRGNSFQAVLGPGGASFGILGIDQTSIRVGGSRNGIENHALMYVGSGAEVFIRTSQDENLRLTKAQFPGGEILDVTVDPANWANAYVADRDDVYVTTNAGDSWRRVTGNLATRGGTEIRSAEFVRRGSGEGYLVVGTENGLFTTSDLSPGRWAEVGNLPHAMVYDIEYDAQDDVLAVGTLGRGAFLLPNAAAEVRASAANSTTAARTATGVVWNDLNGDGLRGANEPGLAGVTVYVDRIADNSIGISEPAAVTNANGVYTITNVPSGNFAVRTALQPGFVQTFPRGAGEYVNNFAVTRRPANLDFGVQEGSGNDEGFDFGDAPAPFPTRLADNGASHGIVPRFQLGGSIDGDLDGRPTPFAGGDDNVGDDEDGIAFLSDLVPNSQATVQVTVSTGSQPAGMLQGWIDFDGDGQWTTSGEQVFSDLTLGAGVHTLSIDVPSWAQQGFTFARFRYGYEPGISFTGRAVAGEVEDYRLEVIKGGPTANDDSFIVRRNSENNNLAILANDALRSNAETVIESVTTASAGGTVQIGANGLIYTPARGFDGTETFTYTLRDRTGLTDTANVSVFVQPDLASIRIEATSLSGTPITSIPVGSQFQLRGLAQDLTTIGTGVFAAYVDVEYSDEVASVASTINYSSTYPNGQSGSSATAGLLDEVGAFGDIEPIGPNETLVFSITMLATQTGTFIASPNPADILPQHNILLYDRNNPIPLDQIEFQGSELTVTPGGELQTNPVNALDVNDDTSVSPLDALLVINQLNAATLGASNAQAEGESTTTYLDVSGDGALSPVDALLIINALNAMQFAAIPAAASAESNVATTSPTDRVLSSSTATDRRAPDIDSVIELLSDDLLSRRNV